MSKTMIGLDPLAWLSADNGTDSSKNKTARKKIARKKASKKKAKKKVVAKKNISKKKVSKKKISRNKVRQKNKLTIKAVSVEPLDELTMLETKTSKIKENLLMGSVVKLKDVQDISQVSELHQQLSALINNTDIVFDGAEVERIDTASLQLLSCVFRQAQKYGTRVSWQSSSEALKKSASLLGLTKVLEL